MALSQPAPYALSPAEATAKRPVVSDKLVSVVAVGTPPKPARLVSLDAYRGIIMLFMASAGFEIYKIVKDHPSLADNPVWRFLGYHFGNHVEWTGCSLWDLIQPSFMFMVGVAIPYSYASRKAKGDPEGRIWFHVIIRAIVLVLLGVFLSSNGAKQTNFTFVNVLSQIGLGYAFVYLLRGRGVLLQLLAVVAILGGYWLLFYLHPVPEQIDRAEFQIPENCPVFTGLAAHWNRNVNFAAWFDQKFLNWFSREKPFTFDGGGYQTLNFVPSMATMLFGLMAGDLLRSGKSAGKKFAWLTFGGLVCLLTGMALDHTIWPDGLADRLQSFGVGSAPYWSQDWTLCPIVKRIWTPTWAIYSTGWTLLMLAGFFFVIDLIGWKKWAFVLGVVGMNSIAIYCMSMLLKGSPTRKGWVAQSLQTHLGQDLFNGTYFGREFFDSKFSPIAYYAAVLFVFWLICVWLYRQRIFIRI